MPTYIHNIYISYIHCMYVSIYISHTYEAWHCTFIQIYISYIHCMIQHTYLIHTLNMQDECTNNEWSWAFLNRILTLSIYYTLGLAQEKPSFHEPFCPPSSWALPPSLQGWMGLLYWTLQWGSNWTLQYYIQSLAYQGKQFTS